MTSKSPCWECSRRGITCDGTRPVCNTCRAAQIVCPGFENNKPLLWLPAGKVKSRTWKQKKRKPKKDTSRSEDSTPAKTPETAAGSAPPSIKRIQARSLQAALTGPSEYNYAGCGLQYFNAELYPHFIDDLLGPSMYITRMSAERSFHDACLPTMICMALGHVMISKGEDAESCVPRPSWPQLLNFRGLALQRLNGAITGEKTRLLETTVRAVILFLFLELQYSTSHSWEAHLSGTHALIDAGGGPAGLLTKYPYSVAALQMFFYAEIVGNTTCAQVDKRSAQRMQENQELIVANCVFGYYPRFTCPPPLLPMLISINSLRCKTGGDVAEKARAILADIDGFSPQTYGRSRGDFHNNWLLIARIYHSAIALYCLNVFPTAFTSTAAKASRNSYRDVLLRDLMKIKDQELHRLRPSVMWPMVVAGYEAANCHPSVRTHIAQQFTEMRIDMGAYLPILAREVLEKFWESEGTTWGECFPRRYAFIA